MTNITSLPIDTQNEIRNTLKAFDRCDVWFEYGKYHVMCGACLRAYYAPDHRFVATFTKDDIYTETEQIENYINEFHCYPANYKGKKDWQMIHKMQDGREINFETGMVKDWQGRINEEGNFELTHQIEYKV